MARKTGAIFYDSVTEVRAASGAIAGDSATLTDANIPPTSAINCAGFETIWIGAEITGGSSPTMVIEPLVYDADAADGARWRRLQVGAGQGVAALAATADQQATIGPSDEMAEIRVNGATLVFLRVVSVANSASTTAWKILARAGRTQLIHGRG
jgi:hypothetical protein